MAEHIPPASTAATTNGLLMCGCIRGVRDCTEAQRLWLEAQEAAQTEGYYEWHDALLPYAEHVNGVVNLADDLASVSRRIAT